MRPAILLYCLLLTSYLYAQSVVTFVCSDVPVAIPDGPDGIAESFMFIEPWYEILDVNVVVTITHSFDEDIRIYLETPYNDVDPVILAYECGGSGNDYFNTRFNDEATTPICSGTPPFTGDFRPFRALSPLDGLLSHGTWTLRVTDNWPDDTGVIQAWRLEILVDTTASVVVPPLVTEFSVGQNFPNPFNPTTTLPVQLTKPALVELTVVNELGQVVSHRKIEYPAGSHALPIDGSGWSSGAYFAEIRSGNASRSVQMRLVK